MNQLPPPPRNVQKTHPMIIGRAIAVLLLATVIVATIGMNLFLIRELVMTYAAKTVTGKINLLYEFEGKPGQPWTYHADYEYDLPGKPKQTGTDRISSTLFSKMNRPYITFNTKSPMRITMLDKFPRSIELKVISVGSTIYSRPVEGYSVSTYLLIGSIFGPLSILLSFTLYLAIIVRPRWARDLYIHGLPTGGMVYDKKEWRVKHSSIWMVYYHYAPPGATESLSGKFMLDPEKWQTMAVGTPLLILYMEKKPRISVPYEYGGYRVIPEIER